MASEESELTTIGVENEGSTLKLGRLDSFDVESSRVSKMNHGSHGGQILTIAATLQLAYQSICVVYGEIGTSPLYAYSSTFSDGGTFALYSVICRHAKVSLIPNLQAEDRELSTYKLSTPNKQLKRNLRIKEALEQRRAAKIVLLMLTLMGTSMVIGDAILTPSISDVVVGISVAILIILFSVQRFGTDRVGRTFAPAIPIWFLFILLIDIYNLAKHDTRFLSKIYH